MAAKQAFPKDNAADRIEGYGVVKWYEAVVGFKMLEMMLEVKEVPCPRRPINTGLIGR